MSVRPGSCSAVAVFAAVVVFAHVSRILTHFRRTQQRVDGRRIVETVVDPETHVGRKLQIDLSRNFRTESLAMALQRRKHIVIVLAAQRQHEDGRTFEIRAHLHFRYGRHVAIENRIVHIAAGQSHSFGGEYLELVPGERLVYTDTFDDPGLPGQMKVTVTLKAVSVGTEINIEQEGIPDVIPREACYLGWQQSLRKLTKLVEPEIDE